MRPFERQGRTRRGDAVAALRRSAIWTACLMLASGAYLSWPLMSWSSFMKVASVEEDGGGLIVLLVLGVAALCTFLGTLHWLCRLPGVFREVNHLLDSTEPTLMRLTVRKRVTPDSDGQATTSWEASLAGDGPDSRLSFTVSGFLPPRWLRSERFWNTPVLVYGLPPPGPYLIELEDGSLAVVHP